MFLPVDLTFIVDLSIFTKFIFLHIFINIANI
jgi:hypothetical protein